jgi:hypothetical protein
MPAEVRKTSSLKPHPEFQKWFGSLSVVQTQDLAEDVKRTGVTGKIQILPDGTVVVGVYEAQAAQVAGVEELKVFVWSEMGAAELLQRMAYYNLSCPYLPPLDRLRASRHVIELALGMSYADWPDRQRTLFRSTFVRSFPARRTAERLLRVLDLPEQIQRLVARGRIAHRQVQRLAHLSRAELLALASHLEEGRPLGSFVDAAMDSPEENAAARTDENEPGVVS